MELNSSQRQNRSLLRKWQANYENGKLMPAMALKNFNNQKSCDLNLPFGTMSPNNKEQVWLPQYHVM